MRHANRFALVACITAIAWSGAAQAQKSGGYTLADVGRHATPDDCWMVVGDDVLVVTDYLPGHRGVPEDLADWCGKDATALFDGLGKAGRKTLRAILDYRVGGLAGPSR